MTYLALNEDSLNNNGLYRGSRWFRMGEFREKSLSSVLDEEVRTRTVERVACLLGKSINKELCIAWVESIKKDF